MNVEQKSVEDLKNEIYRLADEFFQNRENTLTWLNSPIPALGGQIPMHLLESEDGVKQVMTILQRIEYGVYS